MAGFTTVIMHFVDDEDGYLAWLEDHPTGFVVNCERDPKASYLVLHRADCTSVSGMPARGVLWTHTYKKVCAGSVAELDTWARDIVGTVPSRCGRCKP
ncbi:MAG: hypothetical protein ACYCST_12155 [Acidimicrobiales bacterium]